MGIIPLRRGGFVFASQEPSFGLIDSQNRVYYTVKADIGDFRNNLRGFLLSRDGKRVRFGYEPFGKSPAEFDIHSLTLTLSPGKDSNLKPPFTDGRRIKVKDWFNNFHPKLMKTQRKRRE